MTSQEHSPLPSESPSNPVRKPGFLRLLPSQMRVVKTDHEATEPESNDTIGGDQGPSFPLPLTEPSRPPVDESRISISRSINDQHDLEKKKVEADKDDESKYPKQSVAVLVMVSIYLSILLVALVSVQDFRAPWPESDIARRIVPSYQLPFLESLINFML